MPCTSVAHDSSVLLFDRDFGETLEYSGEIEFIECADDEFNAALLFDCSGRTDCLPKPADCTSMQVYPMSHTAVLNDNLTGAAYADTSDLAPCDLLPVKHTFLIQQWKRKVTVYLDGKLLFKDVVIHDTPADETRRIGIGCNYYKYGAELVFRHLCVRRLSKPPVAVPDWLNVRAPSESEETPFYVMQTRAASYRGFAGLSPSFQTVLLTIPVLECLSYRPSVRWSR